MKLQHALFSLVLASLGSVACSASVGVGGMINVPSDASATCATHCSSIGLALDAVVIMANNVGCVCRTAKTAARTDDGSPSSAGGMAAVIMQESERAQQQASHR